MQKTPDELKAWAATMPNKVYELEAEVRVLLILFHAAGLTENGGEDLSNLLDSMRAIEVVAGYLHHRESDRLRIGRNKKRQIARTRLRERGLGESMYDAQVWLGEEKKRLSGAMSDEA